MAYDECETGLITLLRTLTTQFPTSEQVSTNSFILDKGVVNAALIYPGSISISRLTKGPVYDRVWGVLLKLHTAFTEEAAAMTNFKALRAAVVLKIDQNPTLGGVAGVHDTEITSEGDPYLSGPEPIYLAQNFRVSVYQFLSV